LKYLLGGRSFPPPVMETVAGHSVGSLRLAHVRVSHLLVQEVLQGQILLLVVDVVPQLHLGKGGGWGGVSKRHHDVRLQITEGSDKQILRCKSATFLINGVLYSTLHPWLKVYLVYTHVYLTPATAPF